MADQSSRLGFEPLETRRLLSTTTAVQSGEWGSASTWSDGVPDETLRAIIPPDHLVVLTGDDHIAKEIVVQGDLWAIETGSTMTLTSDWIHVNSGGLFQIGAETNRYDENDFIVTLTGEDPNASFEVEGAGTISNNNGFLMVASGGQLQFFGEEKLTYTRLAETANVGASQIVVEAAVDRDYDGDIDAADGSLNWEIGDQIVIASSTEDYRDEEVRLITGIQDQGNGTFVLTLDTSLANRHYGETETYDNYEPLEGDFNDDGAVDAADYTVWRDSGGDPEEYALWTQNFGKTLETDGEGRSWEIDMRAEVAILNRNVKIQGLASQDTDNEFGDRERFEAGTGDGIGAHTMIMASAGQITIDSVQFDRMGQTAIQGRYPIHWHNAGDRTGDILRGASVTNSNNRGVTVHGTHNLLIEGVVLHDIHGHGFFMEDAVETGNEYLANIAFGIHKVGRSEEVGDFAPDLNDPFLVDTHDHVGQNANRFLSSAAYWITNPDNTWIGNISAGSEGTGFWFILPEEPIGDAANNPLYSGVDASRTNLRQFDYNSSHASPAGLNFDRGSDIEVPIGATLKANFDGDQWLPPQEPQINYYTAYKHNVGVYHRGQEANFHENLYADNYITTFITFTQRITDSLYVGYSRGNADYSSTVTGHTIYDGANTLDGNHFAGYFDDNSHTFRVHSAANRFTSHVFSNTSYEEDGSAYNVSIATQGGGSNHSQAVGGAAAAALYDVDGSLTGHVGGGAGMTVVTNHPFFYDSDDFQPAGWNAWVSDDIYAQVQVKPNNTSATYRFTSPDGDSGSESGESSFNTHVKTNDGDYVVDFPDGVSSVASGFDLKYYMRVGPNTGSTVIQFVGLGGVLAPEGKPQVSTLTELRNATSTSWTVVGDDLYVKFFSSSSDIEFDDSPPLIGSTIPLWDDPSPPDNTDGSAVTGITDPFGTGMGMIGQWVTDGQNQYHNVNVGGPVIDISAYDGMSYSFAFDYYVDSSQALSDDTIYQYVYSNTNFTTIGDSAVLDAWTTIITTGTIDVSQGTTINPLIIVNHRNTTETIPSLYIDNIRFEINLPASSATSTASTEAQMLEQEVIPASDSTTSEKVNTEALISTEMQRNESGVHRRFGKLLIRDEAYASYRHERLVLRVLRSDEQQEEEPEALLEEAFAQLPKNAF